VHPRRQKRNTVLMTPSGFMGLSRYFSLGVAVVINCLLLTSQER
jgi:hypothetical protein